MKLLRILDATLFGIFSLNAMEYNGLDSDTPENELNEPQVDKNYALMLSLFAKIYLEASSENSNKTILKCCNCGDKLIFQDHLGLFDPEKQNILCNICQRTVNSTHEK